MIHNQTKLIGFSKVPSLAIPSDRLGTPGSRVTLHVIPRAEGEVLSDDQKLGDVKPRKFQASAKLSTSPAAVGRIDGKFDAESGDSYLMIPQACDHFRVDTSLGPFKISKNKVGRFSYIEMDCVAGNLVEARSKFIEAVYPALDHFSYTMNVCLVVVMIRIVDLTHNTIHIDCTAPYRVQIVPNSQNRLFLEMKPVYSMYREAKNSESDFYKFLCFYKIMEGLLGKMRSKAFLRAKEAGLELKVERDVVPDDEHLHFELKQYAGKSMKAFFDDILTSKFRNAMAHFMTDDGGVLQISDPSEINTYASLALITDLCARQLIAVHERLLEKLPSS
jgi:hypothetical protein